MDPVVERQLIAATEEGVDRSANFGVRNIRDQVSEIGMDPRCCDLFPNVPRLYQMSSQVEIESSCLADPFISFYIIL